MSSRPNNAAVAFRRLFAALMLMGMLVPAASWAQSASLAGDAPPRLVPARQGDTPASLARRYLKDATQSWRIAEYNGRFTFSEGDPVVIPKAPFRLGGLYPDGYQVIPVLAYGEIGASTRRQRRLSPKAFLQQMDRLANEGFVSITPAELIDFMAFRRQLPRKAVLLTIDSQSRTFYKEALPILQDRGLTATVFVAAAQVGQSGAMNWKQLQRLHKAGFTIGCRGQRGVSLTRGQRQRSAQAHFQWMERELHQAKTMIEDRLGQPCRFLAYPKGHTNALVSALAADLGFDGAFNRANGEVPFFANRYDIHRKAVDSRMSLARFNRLLTTKIKAKLN